MSKKKIGRPVGAISAKRRMAMEVMAQLEAELGRNVNPLEGLLRAGADESQPMPLRIQCWSEAMMYLFPKLQAQTVALTGPAGGPVATAHLDVSAILANPELAKTAQALALMVVEAETGDGNVLPPDHPVRALPPASE